MLPGIVTERVRETVWDWMLSAVGFPCASPASADTELAVWDGASLLLPFGVCWDLLTMIYFICFEAAAVSRNFVGFYLFFLFILNSVALASLEDQNSR